MHTIKANGGRLVILHQRSHEEIHARPHITRRKGWGGPDQGAYALWAVYYLMGKQARIRCTLYDTLQDAIRQANYVARVNTTARRM